MPRGERGARGGGDTASRQALVPRELGQRLFAEIRRRPARSLALALGAGYVAGGGIGTILTARLLAVGARIAMRLAVVPLLAEGVERTLFATRAAETNNVHASQ
ncbi:MAG TPA: hypothetical protein VGP07_01515 [Polyangia bacterium]|jgi:hypothetical protein